jgi:hypothetical protein
MHKNVIATEMPTRILDIAQGLVQLRGRALHSAMLTLPPRADDDAFDETAEAICFPWR